MKQRLIAMLIFVAASMAAGTTLNAQQTKSVERPPKTKTSNDVQAVNYDELIDRYFKSLNETDEKRRRELIEQVWTENGVFVYPDSEIKGRAAISADVLKVQTLYPGARVRRVGEIEVLEKNYIRFNWDFARAGEGGLIRGVDFAVVVNGKLHLVVGFFDFIRDKPQQ